MSHVEDECNIEKKIFRLVNIAKDVRKNVISMIYTAQSGHPGGSLSAADIMTALYFDELNVKPSQPNWDGRDRFVLSKGHVCPVLYVCLGMRGYFSKEYFNTLRKHGSILQGHPDMKRCPGIDISTGSLGQGLSVAVGMALRAKRDNMDYRVFALLGDGECDEGQIWEATECASKYGLDNLTIIVDSNKLQNDGSCEDIMPLRDLQSKFSAFGCNTVRIDGHDMASILQAFYDIRTSRNGKPNCIIADTVKGKGVSFMENVVSWHGTAPNAAQYAQAIEELEKGLS